MAATIAGAVLTATVVGAGSAAVARPAEAAAPADLAHAWPSGAPVDLATGLDAPWSILQLHDANQTVLISERDTGRIQRVTASGDLDRLATVPGVHHIDGGEGGLLGLATLVDGGTRWIYAYLSTTSDNRIVRMQYTDPGDPADATLGAPQVILSGLRVAQNHNGGRIAFGPDGMLYATVGDVNDHSLPQKKSALNGKILRMTPTGGVPADNPFAGSLVYSYGHRNPQGLAWDAEGQLWSSELGQNTWDEFNRIEPGGNYGWPLVEGTAGDSRYVDPWLQWPTSQASPSGLAYVDGTFFMAALRGTRLWAITVDDDAGTASATALYVDTIGRIRDVADGPGDTLWMLSNNTRRGGMRPGDDRLVQVQLVEAARVEATIACATCEIAGRVQLDVALQRRVSGEWRKFRRTHGAGGPGGVAVAFDGLPAGTYRTVTIDTGGGGYLTQTSAAFTVATSGVSERQILLAGTQLDRDLSGDGYNDVLARDDTGAVVRFDGNAGGGFDAADATAGTATAATAQVGDLDRDGNADVVTRDAGGMLTLLRGDGAGGWLGTSQVKQVTATQDLLVGPGDWNGDGKPDIITRDSAGSLWLYPGDGAGGVASKRVRIVTGWNRFVTVLPVGDFSGDRKPDLLAQTASGEVWIYRSNGTGALVSRLRAAIGWDDLTDLVSPGDVTGDARPDILARDAGGVIHIYAGTAGALQPGAAVLPDAGPELIFAS